MYHSKETRKSLLDFNSLKYKIIIIFIIPALGMLYFSSKYVSEEYHTLKQVGTLAGTISFAKNVSELIHELQKERGLSSAYLGKDYLNFTDSLKKQRVFTDKAYQEFLHSLSENQSSLDNIFTSNIKAALSMMQELPKYRTKIDNRTISFYKEVTFFSKTVSTLLSSIPHLRNGFASKEMSNSLESLFYLINMKEYAGIERAFLSNVFSQDMITAKQYKDIQKLIIQEKIYYHKFTAFASLKIFQSFQKNISQSMTDQLASYRAIIDTQTDKFNIDPMEWYSFATDRINRLNKVLQHLMTDISNKNIMIKNNAYYSLIISAVFWLFSIIALAVLIFILRKLISGEEKNIHKLQEQRKHFTALSYMSENIVYLDNKDAIYNSLCRTLVQVSEFNIAWIALVDKEKKCLVPYVSNNINLQKFTHMTFSISPDQSKRLKIQEKAYLEKNHIIVKEKGLLPPKECLNILDENIDSAGAFPIYNDNEIIAILSLYSEDREIFNLELIDLIERMLKGVSFALSKIDIQQQQYITKENLRIASYAFDAQEAMTITDANANIIKVNKAFTEITGYSAEEAIGKNPKILQSSHQDQYFYQKMWKELKEKGRWKGEIYNQRKNGEVYPEVLSITAIKDDTNLITHYIAQFLDISNIKNAQKEAEHKADHDILTGLTNRSKLLEETEAAFKRGKKSDIQHAFMFLDIDNFKQVNDFYGHQVGDALLVEIASRLRHSMRDGDIVARLGGDEFAIIVLDLDSDEHIALKKVSLVAKNIKKLMLEPIVIDSQSFDITFSIGIKLFPDQEKTVQDIISHADIAMYQAKKSGRNQFAFFDHELNLESKRFLLMEKDLKHAVKNNEFELYYQPKVDITTEKIIGFEALLRWNHPTKGILYPDAFLGVANETRLILDIGDFVISQACKQLSLWNNKSKGLKYTVSINVSAHQFQKPEFVSSIKESIEHYNIDASFLELELLEDTLIKDMDLAIKKMNTLKDLGIKFSIDDFGTGYSSMTYLQKLPVDSIKIDKSFIMDFHNPSNQEIVKMIINFTKLFNLKVIAEGVENKLAVEFLKQNGCDSYQGFYFSRALQVKEATALL